MVALTHFGGQADVVCVPADQVFGMAALQPCRTMDGLVVFGTAWAAKHGALRAEGCMHPIDYRAADYPAEIRRLSGRRAGAG